MDLCVKVSRLRLRWKMKRMKREWKMRRGEVIKSHSIMNCCSIPVPPSCTYCRSEPTGWVLPIWQSPESCGLKPILINPCRSVFFLFLQICGTSRNEGLKRNQATVSCRSSQQSYLVWACHLSGQWMHEIREGEEEENVSTTAGEGYKGERGLGLGVGEGVTWRGEESN